VTFAGKIQERIPRITKTRPVVAIYPAVTAVILAVGRRAEEYRPGEAKKETRASARESKTAKEPKESKRESKKESKKK
jgi:hypothetical protein